MQITIYRLNDTGDNYDFRDICLQYDTLEIHRDISLTGSASFVLVNDYEESKFRLDDLIVFNKDPSEKGFREHYIVIDITRNKDVRTNVIKTTVTAIPMINYILGNRVQTFDSRIGAGTEDYYVMQNIVWAAISDYSRYEDCKISAMWNIYGDRSFATKTEETFYIPKNKTALDNAKALGNCYNYYSKLTDFCLYSANNTKINFAEVYPTDKSDSIIFSENMGNCVLTDYTLNNENEKNVCYSIASDGTVTVNGAGVGLKRKEMLSEKETYNSELDTAKQITNAKITILNNGMYEYLKDYDLNTIVSFYDNNLGIQIAKPIESITEYYSNDKNEIEISIGEFVPNVFDKLKGV